MPDIPLQNFEGEQLDATNMRFGFVVSETFKQDTEELLKGVIDRLVSYGVNDASINVRKVPSCFDLVYGCSRMSDHSYIDAIIALGVEEEEMQSIRQGLQSLNAEGKIPVIYGVIAPCGNLADNIAKISASAIKMVDFAHSFD